MIISKFQIISCKLMSSIIDNLSLMFFKIIKHSFHIFATPVVNLLIKKTREFYLPRSNHSFINCLLKLKILLVLLPALLEV